jgi:glycosidase
MAFSQDFSIQKIEPSDWWVGMRWDTLQLMVYGDNLEGLKVRSSYDKLKIVNTYSFENKSYFFVDLFIPGDIEPGNYALVFSKNEFEQAINFPILSRETLPEEHNGFSNKDVIYLIFADRFCDGNSENNTIGDSLDQFTSADLDGRKGGDIEGIISKLDYLKELGVTAIWITPMLENNMWMSYHGYAATDLYKIDPRFGSNDLYKKLVEEAHKRGLKIILDHVSNHIGINHDWVKNLPMQDWFNGTPENFMKASHDKMAFLDIHGDPVTIKTHQQGWFTNYMPDLNQRNSFLKKYLIQNTIWWIEYAGIDGIREDTYPYNDQKYLSEWAEAILSEYSNFNIVGEIWQGVPSVISGYQRTSPVRKIDFNSNLPSVTDFALSDAIRDYLGGTKGIDKIYETIAQDIVYADPDNLLVFFDNHDVDRALLVAKGNLEKYKIALNVVLFTRGIPQIFYGTEIGIAGGTKHGELRQPFPGGFSGDTRNAFSSEGRSETENELFNYLQDLLALRNKYPSLSSGKLRHIYPFDDIYILVKYFENETTMIFINSREEELSIQSSQLKNFVPEAKELLNLQTREEINLNSVDKFQINKMTTEIFLIRN